MNSSDEINEAIEILSPILDKEISFDKIVVDLITLKIINLFAPSKKDKIALFLTI